MGIREELENRVRIEPSNPEFTLELTALRVEGITQIVVANLQFHR